MATVSGRLEFDRARTSSTQSATEGIANVPIVLQNTATNEMLAVLTDANGNYSFTNVPNGNYRIVESYGAPTVTSPGNFAAATVGNAATAAFPPIGAVNNPPAGATNLDATLPTTRLVTVSGSNLTNQDFLNGPVKYTPITTQMDSGVIVSSRNLITFADNGTFGSFPPGTVANTGANPNPYTNIGSQFIYSLPNTSGITPGPKHYTIQNLLTNATAATQGTWWRIADHTSGNETGRMMVINGDAPGSIIFEQNVAVTPNTYYLFSSWILNLAKTSSLLDPSLGVEVLDQNGAVLYKATLGSQIPMSPNYPEWKEIGTVINSKNNSSLTVRFISMGPEANGNDYAIDDISLKEVRINAYSPVKSADKTEVNVGDTVKYTVTLQNTGLNPLTSASLKDLVPDGFTFVPGSVTVNGQADFPADPNTGFAVPDIPGGSTLTVTFLAKADHIPVNNPTINNASVTYSYSPVIGGIPDVFTRDSNDVPVQIIASADLSVTKTADKNPVQAGDILTYTVTVTNNGPNDAFFMSVNDSVPSSLTNPEFSVDGGVTWKPWRGVYIIRRLPVGQSLTILIRGTVSQSASGVLANTASASSPTHDPNPDNNSATSLTPVRITADLAVTKSADKSQVKTGDTLTYTVTATNNGPNDAQGVSIFDNISTGLSNPQYSLDGGITWKSWRGAYSLASLPAGGNFSVLIRGTVSQSAAGVIPNTATVSSTTPDSNPNNNSSTVLTPVIKLADLSVTKACDKNPVNTGDVLTYTLTAVNNGPNIAQNVTITDNIPAALNNPEYSIDGGVTWQQWTGAFSLAELAVGAKFSVMIRGTVIQTQGVIANTVTVNSSTLDPNPSNNSMAVITPINVPNPSVSDIAIVKTADKAQVIAGDLLTYTLTTTNNGPDDTTGSTVIDNVPTGMTGLEFSDDGGVTWKPWNGSYEGPALANGQSFTILMRGTVSQSAAGTIANTATAVSPSIDPNPINNSSVTITPIVIPVPPSADISITKTADKDPVLPGEVLTYTLTASNAGPDTATDVTIADNMSTSLTGAEFSVDGGVTWQPWTGSYKVPSIAAGGGLTLLVRGTVSQSAKGTVNNTAVISSPTGDPDPNNNDSTTLTPINDRADLSVLKKGDKNPVLPGDVLTYTITAANKGPAIANDVTLTDDVPDSLMNPEYSVDGGATWQPWDGVYSPGALRAGDSFSILIRGTVGRLASGVIANTATISSSSEDPNSDDNSSTELTPVNISTDISVTKTADKAAVNPGDQLVYTVTAANNGPNTAYNVVLADTVPADLLGAEYSADGGLTWFPWNGAFDIGTMNSGDSVKLLIRGIVGQCPSGFLDNSVSVTSPTPDTNPGNNSAGVTTPITQPAAPPPPPPPPVPAPADLSIVKTACPYTFDGCTCDNCNNSCASCSGRPGVLYTLEVTNNGPGEAAGTVVTDELPEDIIGGSYSVDNGVTWNEWDGSVDLGTLPANTTVKILIRGEITDCAPCSIKNTAKVSSASPDENFQNNTAENYFRPNLRSTGAFILPPLVFGRKGGRNF